MSRQAQFSLHIDRETETDAHVSQAHSQLSCTSIMPVSSQVLLSTIRVNVKTRAGNIQSCTALLDSASQSNFISSSFQRLIGVQKKKINMTIIGNYKRYLQDIWSRWSKEYIGELQQRQKWKKMGPQVTKGIFVLIKDNNLPPFSWKLGRVIDTHPGEDGIIRVVSVQTSLGILRRAVSSICPLPINRS
ncbi:hypothetical protein JTB14_012535 [Gonioctena quinquepunctata]|nr:hypothetical protein JTB14_012535 [Gonioctena quinquepunctata]